MTALEHGKGAVLITRSVSAVTVGLTMTVLTVIVGMYAVAIPTANASHHSRASTHSIAPRAIQPLHASTRLVNAFWKTDINSPARKTVGRRERKTWGM